MPELAPGGYIVLLLGEAGEQLAHEEIELTRDSGPVAIELDLVWVEGTVHLGEEPLPAQVVFGGRRGAVRIPLTADLEGHFAGALPREGRWLIYVENEAPPVKRTVEVMVSTDPEEGIARIEIELPDIVIGGQAVDEEGRPVAGAFVTVASRASADMAWVIAEEEGRFELRGLGPGEKWVSAEAPPNLASETLPVSVSEEDSAEDLRLVLHPRKQISGRVVTASGPRAGVEIAAVPLLAGGLLDPGFMPTAASGIDGRFVLDLPASAVGAELIAMSPGFTLWIERLVPLPEEETAIVLEQDGGTLALDLPVPIDRTGVEISAPLLFHRGLALPWSLLHRWAAAHGAPLDDPLRLVAPLLPPGPYRACWVEPREAAGFVSDPRPETLTRCADGYLPPLGELHLAVPGGLDREEGE